MTIYQPPLIVGAQWEGYELIAERPMTEYAVGKFMILSDRDERVRAYGVLFTNTEVPEQLRRVEDWHVVRELQKRHPDPSYDLPLGGGVLHFHHSAKSISIIKASERFGKVPGSILEKALKVPNHTIEDAGDELAILGQIELHPSDIYKVRAWYTERGFEVEEPFRTSILR
jgi:hypothetical protein